MGYTGTFLGGPFDGEIKTFDSKFYMRADPEDDANKFGILTGIPECEPETIRLYEWIQDDDGRGWWVLVGVNIKWV